MTSDQSISVRHRGREAALQLLYQWEVGSEGVTRSDEFSEGFWDSHPAPTCRKFATELVKGTMEHLVTIDPLLESTATNWRLDRMALIDRLIMRMAMYELIYTDTPKAVIIDEVSMVDVPLMASLCRAIRPEASLLLVGDADQLPSVGPGLVRRAPNLHKKKGRR